MFCSARKCKHCFLCAAMVDVDPEKHWYDASGNVLPPSCWISSDEPDEDDTFGSCIGLHCRPWQRCQKADDMVHNLFGCSGRDSAVGWAALTRPPIPCGVPKFYGGLKVLASLQVILGQFLLEEAGGWFPSLCLPPSEELLTMRNVCNPITLTWCSQSLDTAMITRCMLCAPIWNPKRLIKALGRPACVVVCLLWS
jgi:hypothetical protein